MSGEHIRPDGYSLIRYNPVVEAELICQSLDELYDLFCCVERDKEISDDFADELSAVIFEEVLQKEREERNANG